MDAAAETSETEPDSSDPTSPAAPAGRDAVPTWLARGAGWSARLLIIGVGVYATFWVLARFRVVVLPVLLALLLASVLSPAADRLERRGIPRLGATWLVVAGSFATLLAIGALLVPPFVGELGGLGERLTEAVDDVEEWARGEPLELSQERLDRFRDSLSDQVSGGEGAVSGRLLSGATLLAEFVTGLLLTVVLVFFFVKDGREIWAWLLERTAPARADRVDRAGRAASQTAAGWLGGVAITGVFNAVLIGLGLWIIGVPLVLPLAVLTFFGAFLPVLGATVTGALAALVALVSGGVTEALLVVALTLVVQQIEGNVLLPVVMGRQVPLHPAVVLVALTAGGVAAGIVGALLAVPTAAVATVVARELRPIR